MGSCLVVYGRREVISPWLPASRDRAGVACYIYTRETPLRRASLWRPWLCGLVIEVGPVAQGVLDARIIRQTRLALEAALEGLLARRRGDPFP